PEEPVVTFNPGLIVGGTTVDYDSEQQRGRAFGKTNVIAGRAVVAGDLRTFTPEQLRRTRERMTQIVAQSLPHTQAHITFDDGYPPMAASEGNTRLLGLLDAASRDLGFGAVTAVDPRQAGAADISFVAAEVGTALDGVGLMGTGGHTVNETADLTTLPRQAKRVAVMLARLAASRDATSTR
ncbi:MAG: M20/M25/M40 family metallo-hydrolase, partial [bacterium]